MGQVALAALTEDIQKQLERWKALAEKLGELDEWLGRAKVELKNISASDPLCHTYAQVAAARNDIEQEINQVEAGQESALAEHLRTTGPLTIQLQDGSRRVLAAQSRTAGGAADLLPADLLRVWRVAAVFGGSVETLRFGDERQVAEVKQSPKLNRHKAVPVTEGGTLFGHD